MLLFLFIQVTGRFDKLIVTTAILCYSAAMELIPKADFEKRGYIAYAAQFSDE